MNKLLNARLLLPIFALAVSANAIGQQQPNVKLTGKDGYFINEKSTPHSADVFTDELDFLTDLKPLPLIKTISDEDKKTDDKSYTSINLNEQKTSQIEESNVKPEKIAQELVIEEVTPAIQVISENKLVLLENKLLSEQLNIWAKQNNYKLLWNCDRDYLIYSSINISGKDKYETLEKLGNLFSSQNYGLVIKLYEKNNVLIIDEY